MELFSYVAALFDFILHIDDHLVRLVADYGMWIYAIMFLIVFVETGVVVMPFLPGDSLLFAAGALCAAAAEAKAADPSAAGLSIWILLPLLSLAAILGDQTNYAIGRFVGPKFLEQDKLPLIKKAHVQKTQAFYDNYGKKTVILARFVPIVRTFAPFVAGIGKMAYGTFITFNIVGGIAWVAICSLAGYFFGRIPVVQHNFELVVLGIIGVSVLPMVIEIGRAWLKQRNASSNA